MRNYFITEQHDDLCEAHAYGRGAYGMILDEELCDCYVKEMVQLGKIADLANKVMKALKEHGPSIVPHLLDSDDNDGERLRQALKDLEKLS